MKVKYLGFQDQDKGKESKEEGERGERGGGGRDRVEGRVGRRDFAEMHGIFPYIHSAKYSLTGAF